MEDKAQRAVLELPVILAQLDETTVSMLANLLQTTSEIAYSRGYQDAKVFFSKCTTGVLSE